jgi:hypothetical protein
MKTLQATNGFVIQVSDDDFDWLSQWTWQARVALDDLPKAIYRQGPSKKTIYMAREILKRRGINPGRDVDHKDRNVLNNQFENLRPATRSQNNANKPANSNSSSGYKGVYYDKGRLKYLAAIQVKGERIRLGAFTDPLEAARAYDVAAKRYFREFAYLNFPEHENE